jgi:hypothetical protein
MRKETALRGGNVKYISSSRLIYGAPLDNVFTQEGEPKTRDLHPTGDEGRLT